MTKATKYTAPTLNVTSFQSRGAGALKKLDGITLPTDIVTDLNRKVANAQQVRAAEIKSPTFTDLANRLAAGGTVTAADITAEQAAVRMREVQGKAHEIALAAIDAAVQEYRDDIIEAVAAQLVTPAVAKMQTAAHLAGTDPGTLFTSRRDKDAKTLRDAVAAHADLVRAYDIRAALGVQTRNLGPCAAWQPHDQLNTPDVGDNGTVTVWRDQLTEKQARDFGRCMDLVSRGAVPWLPTEDQAVEAQGDVVAEHNADATPARLPQNYKVNGRATMWHNG